MTGVAGYVTNVRNYNGLLFCASASATAYLTDCRNSVDSFFERFLVCTAVELGYLALFVASLVETAARLAFAFIGVPVCLFLGSERKAEWLIVSAFFPLFNAYTIATGALVQNICAAHLPLYGSAPIRRRILPQHYAINPADVAGYAVNRVEMVDAEVLTIPEATGDLDVVAEFNRFLDLLGPLNLLDSVDDDGIKRSYDEFTRKCRDNLATFFHENQDEKSRKFANVLKHVIGSATARWNNLVASMDAESLDLVHLHIKGEADMGSLLQEQITAVHCIRDVAKIIQKTGVTLYHCSNRKSAEGEDLYWEFVVNDPTFIEKKTIGYRARCVLAEARDQIFYAACERACDLGGDKVHRAATHNYYRRTLAATYGVPAEISQHDRAYESCAKTDYEHVFQEMFEEQYTVPFIVHCIRRCINSPIETVFPSGPFNIWFRQVYRGDRSIILDEQERYTTRAILAFLEHEGIVQRVAPAPAAAN